MDKGTENTITASSLNELMDKLEAATPAGKIAVCQGSVEVTMLDPYKYPEPLNKIWKVTFTLKEAI